MVFVLNLIFMTKKDDEGMSGRFLCLRLVPKKPKQIVVDAGIMQIKIVQEGYRPPLFKGFPRAERFIQFFHGKVDFRFG